MSIMSPGDAAAGLPVSWDKVGQCREMGKVPDVGLIEPGDVILFSPVKPNLMQKTIIRTQNTLAPSHRAWTHAAIAFDGGRMVEALTKKGVCCGTIFDRCRDFRIKVRRAHSLNQLDRMRLAMDAMSAITTNYSLKHALAIGFSNLFQQMGKEPFYGKDSHIVCSQLISNAYMNVTGQKLISSSLYRVTPGQLDSTKNLTDVTIGWRPLTV